LKKKYSLKGRLCFRSVFLEGKIFRRKYCFFYVLKNCTKNSAPTCHKSENTLKLGIIVTKSMGNACIRNNAKRKFRAAFRQEILSYNSDLCMVAKLRNDFYKIDIEQIRKDIRLFLQETGLDHK
jgi:ribonuclease P protein component